MYKQLAKFGATFASVTIVVTTFSPVAFAETLEISGNGKDSNNTITVVEAPTDVLVQSNKTAVLTAAFSSASTGGNEANGNVGSGVDVKSGDATAKTSVSVGGSSNTATVEESCGCATPPDVLISGNGKNSTNKVTYTKAPTDVKIQKNKTFVGTLAGSKAKTGKNKANGNTGGTVDVTSGDAKATTTVDVTGSTNTLNP